MNFEINNRIKILNKYSNIDALYGPYNSIEEACSIIPEGLRGKGLTIGIINRSGEVLEYWWNTDNVGNEDLKQKVELVDLTIFTSGSTSITVEEGESIVFRFGIQGRASIQKGFVYQVTNGMEVFQYEFANIGKSDNNSIVAVAPSVPGIYTYRIKVVDTTGAFAKNEDGTDYIEYEVRYGGISIVHNFSNFDKILIKNVLSIANQYFISTINVRDDSFLITGIYLTDGDDVNISLTPNQTLLEPSDSYLGQKFYILPSAETLYNLNGKFCYIRVDYTENNVSRSAYTELFTLLDVTSLEFVQQSAFKEYYVNFPDYYTFLLKSGVLGTSVYISQDVSSDFTFESVTVTAYNNFSLRIIPKSIKQNAQLIINCAYIIGNVLQSKRFEITIGNINELPERQYYYPSAEGPVSLDVIVSATNEDLQEGTRYYKAIDDQTSDEYNTCAFVLDTYCKINQVNNKNLKYILIFQGDVEIGYVTEDIINCRGIITDTPLNEWVQIGFGYNLEESVNRNNQTITTVYHAIYINGMIVKNLRTDDGSSQPISYDPTKPITIKLANGIYVHKSQIYYKNNGQRTIDPTATIYSIMYTNYLAHEPNFEEPADLPVLKLMRVTDLAERHTLFDLISQQNEDLKHLTTFGTIGLEKAYAIDEYDVLYYTQDTSIDRDDASLFRQSVDIKKPALKEYAVLCKGLYIVDGVNLLENCIIEVHTLGTSTLVYPVPNFKFTFWKIEGNLAVRFNPDFIEKSEGEYFQESIYTAKADYMDSSHLNNTPTCNFYNNLVQSLISNESFTTFNGSPSAANGNLDAIMGFPIVLEISDSAANMSDAFINIGSFMLNVDKTGDSLGFETDGLSCLSLEGTSNDNEHGAAGRFIIPDGLVLKDYRNIDGTLNTSEIDADANEVQSAITASGKKLNLDSTLGGDLVQNHPYVKWCKFLSEGLEYRYPDSDIYKTSTSGTTTYLTKILKAKDFKKIYKMWIWVNESDTNNNYTEEFPDHFDLNYCMLYFIQLMIFGQTDNLGKNAMFDTWDGEHWYPRPYDLDSQAGLDNNGNDNVATFVEIKPEFSLNYNPNYTQQELEDNYLLEESLIPYGVLTYKRYHYSSNSSKLWINFYKNYKNVINSFYKQLRTTGGYTPDAIINLCETNLINKLGILQYNKDFTNKYLATGDQSLAYGNRWIKFKKWIRLRFAFCDSYFGASDIGNYNLVSAISYNMTVASPQYIIQSYQSSDIVKFVTDRVSFTSGSAAATKLTVQVNQNQVLNTTLFKYVSYQSGPRNYTDIISLDVSGNKLLPSIESVVGTNLNNLKELNVSNSAIRSLNYLPTNLRTLTAENILIDSISIPQNASLETISFKGTLINTNISFNMLPHLRRLDLTGCTINGNLVLANLPKLEEFIIDGAKFNGSIIIQNNVSIDEFDFTALTVNSISFDGNDINITKLNFHNTIFGQSTINMDAISRNVEEIYFNGCTNLSFILLSQNVKFQSLTTFSIQGSPIISLGSVEGEFDASCLNNISSLRKVSFNSSNAISYSQFNFSSTKIQVIRNLTWNGSGDSLFYNCEDLTRIYGTLNITGNLNSTFWRCLNLQQLPTITVSNNVTSALWTFAGANLLTYAEISAVIKLCTNVSNFTGALFCKKFSENISLDSQTWDVVVDFDDLFRNNSLVSNLTFFLCPNRWSYSITSVSNKVKIVGKIPSSVTTLTRALMGLTLRVPYDFISSSTSITGMYGMFAGSSITFYIPSRSDAQLPVYLDSNENPVTCTDAVNSDFFPVNVVDIGCVFEGSNVQLIDSNVFSRLTNLQTCNSAFRGSHSGLFSKDLQIDTLWSQCPNISNISGCFSNVRNVYCAATLRFHNNINTNSIINISGLFGLDSWNENSLPITIDLDNDLLKPKLITSNYYSINGNTTRYAGTFQNRKVYITSSNANIFSKLRGDCTNMFYGAKIYLNSSVTSFDLSNVGNISSLGNPSGNAKQAYAMFYGCQVYENESPYNRKFITVTMPTDCVSTSYMFYGSLMLGALPLLRSSNTLNLSYMFGNCVINLSEVSIPANYFLVCKNTILNVSNMFYSNKYITELLYDSEVGLFQDCTNLTNVIGMFNGCHFLHKGVPNNLFGLSPLNKILSLQDMFKDTSIFYDVQNESLGGKRWMNSNTLAPLSNLQSVQGMFSYMRIGNNASPAYTYNETVKDSDDNTVYIIDKDTFASSNLLNIRELFYRTSTVQNIPFSFQSFEYALDAFCDSRITQIANPFITNEDNMYNVKNVSRMFAAVLNSNKSVTNLGAFITGLKDTSNPVMTHIAGNLTNLDIDDTSLINGFTLDVNYGHSINNKQLY